MRVRIPSLELSFIPLSLRKGLPTPDIVMVDDPTTHNGYGGYYDPVAQQIVVASGCDDVETVLAHEWRHHWQLHAGWTGRQPPFDISADYWREVVRVFSFSPREHDALLFEFAICSRPDPWAEEWLIRCQRAQTGLFSCVS